MDTEIMIDKVLELSIEHWNQKFVGISALEICEKLSVSNKEVMEIMENLRDQGKGSINANVELYPAKFNPDNLEWSILEQGIITHMFFPSKEVLTDYFYSSSLVRENHPEFKKRLHCGAHQIELAVFSDEVLTRYFDHPELYEVDDSLSGGDIWSRDEAPENRYLSVRHGKKTLKNGRTAVTAIIYDLSIMSAEEQRYWHTYEITEEEFEQNDENFMRFIARNYEGAWVDFPDLIKDVTDILININTVFGKGGLFKHTSNGNFRPPVENTEKAYYDCCSEFYKLIGPDSINQDAIKSFLIDIFSVKNSDMINQESDRPLSSIQLLWMLEKKMGKDSSFSDIIKEIKADRIKADHCITKPVSVECNFVRKFFEKCEEFIKAGECFKEKIHRTTSTEGAIKMTNIEEFKNAAKNLQLYADAIPDAVKDHIRQCLDALNKAKLPVNATPEQVCAMIIRQMSKKYIDNTMSCVDELLGTIGMSRRYSCFFDLFYLPEEGFLEFQEIVKKYRQQDISA